jgi:hypothetical protein
VALGARLARRVFLMVMTVKVAARKRLKRATEERRESEWSPSATYTGTWSKRNERFERAI